MTEQTRSSTLNLRRSTASALTSRSRPARTTPATTPVASSKVINSNTLLQGLSHISIMHNGETYQLRSTRLGKLILTK
ncbi:hemin uptake protein HemP [Paraburkholderia bonniea]|uniref:hemin uptake protein HemP n=1 Tax=Paraburkholderia bonniea TaxID=2152891 RepID=UPI0012908EB1|nr:hemin uptake protein HemP [Paraburkholderia bonniea]WJF91105.1 hemin uptake protein HemP [Paraburkholderia bonniea]WJF94420.1 hemin uptake protein HemP [Paraburkholderia bonniea]